MTDYLTEFTSFWIGAVDIQTDSSMLPFWDVSLISAPVFQILKKNHICLVFSVNFQLSSVRVDSHLSVCHI